MTEVSSTVSIQVPEALFRRLEHIAEITHRSVEDILISTVSSALSPDPNLPAEVADELAAMSMFNDDALWAASEASMSRAQQERLRQLNDTVDVRSLTEAETKELEHLLALYDRAVLRRARALALLAHRGYDIAQHDESQDTANADNQNPQTT